jgi:hypothetical protein
MCAVDEESAPTRRWGAAVVCLLILALGVPVTAIGFFYKNVDGFVTRVLVVGLGSLFIALAVYLWRQSRYVTTWDERAMHCVRLANPRGRWYLVTEPIPWEAVDHVAPAEEPHPQGGRLWKVCFRMRDGRRGEVLGYFKQSNFENMAHRMETVRIAAGTQSG